MFPKKKHRRIENTEGNKEIIFEEGGREMNIEKLSSGEKQIVFRGSFLLSVCPKTRCLDGKIQFRGVLKKNDCEVYWGK